jgi:hypothetical protein
MEISHKMTSTIPLQRILVGTHHKTGTVLMKKIFSCLSPHLGAQLCINNHRTKAPPSWSLVLDTHSTLLASLPADSEGIRSIHVVRDPRMIIVSSALYHMHSKERWLHTPRDSLGGKTYQEHILSLPDDSSRFCFELEQGAARNALRDLDIISRLEQPWRMGVNLEALMQDFDLMLYRKIFEHLGLKGPTMDMALNIALENSVFNPSFSSSGHVRARRPEDWRAYLSPDVALELEQRFPGLVCRLGYD